MIETLTNNLEAAIQSAPLLAILISLAAGIITSFTPCVYPLIPITVGFIGAKGSAFSHVCFGSGYSLLFTGCLCCNYGETFRPDTNQSLGLSCSS